VSTIFFPMNPESRQALVIRVEASLARAARAFLGRTRHGYASLDELVEVALLNQLSIEGFPLRESMSGSPKMGVGAPLAEQGESDDALYRVQANPADATQTCATNLGQPKIALAEAQPAGDERLFVMTNRLSPIKIAARSLALCSSELSSWPTISSFQARASAFARTIGLRLRAEGSRRWVGYPVGRDTRKASERFVNSFTITTSAGRGRGRGPMALLGLAVLVDEVAPKSSYGSKRSLRSDPHVALTEAGWKLANLPCSILDECDGGNLSPDEATLLTTQLMRAPRERDAIRVFLGLVRRSGGSQSRVDELMAAREPQKSADLLVAERAAIVGRLADLNVVLHEGRGSGAQIALTSFGRDLLTELQAEANPG
jgi:hypothetical protein